MTSGYFESAEAARIESADALRKTKGKILSERAVTVEYRDGRVHVAWDGKVQYSTVQDGWTSEAGAIREAATLLFDTVGCWVEVALRDSMPFGGGAVYSMRLRVKD